MNETQALSQPLSFSKFVWVSLAFHAAVVLIFTVKIALFPSRDIQIRNAIRVDMVALPEKRIVPAKKATAAPKVNLKETKAATPKKVAKKVDTKALESKALDKLKALEAIDKLRQQMNQAKARPKPVTFKGNFLSKGSALTGLEKIEFDDYFDKLQAAVKAQWDLPQWLANANLKAQVLVVINARGVVTDRKIVASSNNEIFDNQVITAIDRASPLPPPPSRLAAIIETKGIIFNFP